MTHKPEENLDPTDEELTTAFDEVVNGASIDPSDPESSQESDEKEQEQEDPKEEDPKEEPKDEEDPKESESNEEDPKEEPKKETSQVDDLKAKNNRLTSKKNKWKEKYNTLKQEKDALISGEKDDEFADEKDRDRAIAETSTELTYAKNKSEELAEQEVDDFFMVNTDVKDDREAIEQIMEKHGMEIGDAHKFFLATTAPEKLYDQQKINQSNGGNGMMGGEGSAGTKKVSEKSADELEQELIDSHKKGNQVLN